MAFSAGLDSSFLAWKILTKTDDELSLFWLDTSHIVCTDSNGHDRPMYNRLLDAERITIPHVVNWLSQNIRPVTCETIEGVRPDPLSTMLPGATARSWRVIPMLRVAADIVNARGLDRFVYARSPENIRT